MALGLVEGLVGWLVSSTGNAAVGRIRDPRDGILRTVVDDALRSAVDEVAAELSAEETYGLLAALRNLDVDTDAIKGSSLTSLSTALRAWVGRLNQPVYGEAGYLTQLGVDADRFCQALVAGLVAGIDRNGRDGGPLRSMADGLRHDQLVDLIEGRHPRPPTTTAARQPLPAIFDHVDLSRFTGRRWLTEQVDEFLTRQPCGFVWVEAEAGLGKTTYAAQLVRSRGYAGHFTRLPGGRDSRSALRNLAAQLVERHGLDAVAPGRMDTREGFAALLHTAAEHATGPVVIVLDGLDEAEQNAGFALGLPRLLPHGVYVIGTYRTGNRPDEPDSPHRTVRIEPEDRDNLADVAEYLAHRLADDDLAALLRRDGVAADDLAATLVERCAGVWVYLTYVLEELRLGRRTIAEVPSLPANVVDYYVATVRRWRRDQPEEWPRTGLPVLAALAAAAEPVTVDVVADFAGIPDRHRVRELCDSTFRPFLAVADGKPRRYATYHAGFREFLHGGLPGTHPDGHHALADTLGDQVAAAHSRICDVYLARFGGLRAGLSLLGADPALADAHGGYARRHLTRHLTSAGRSADLHALLACEHRLPGTGATTNVWHACHDGAGTIDAYLDDLAVARDSEPDALGAEIRYGLMAASVYSTIDATDVDLVRRLCAAKVWGPDRAVAWAQVQRDPVRRAQAARLVAAEAPARRADLVAGTFDAVRATHDPARRAHGLHVLLPLLSEEQRAEVVDMVLADLRSSSIVAHEQATLLSHFAAVLTSEGLDTALAVATDIDDVESRVDALAALVPYLSGERLDRASEQAFALLPDLRNDLHRGKALNALAPFVRPADVTSALAYATADVEETHRAETVAAALPYADDEERAAALAASRRANDQFENVSLFFMQVHLLAEAAELCAARAEFRRDPGGTGVLARHAATPVAPRGAGDDHRDGAVARHTQWRSGDRGVPPRDRRRDQVVAVAVTVAQARSAGSIPAP